MRTLSSFCSGSKRHGRPGATFESKRTVTVGSITCPGARSATCVVPANPVERQNQLYSGTAANAAPTMQATKTPQAPATSTSGFSFLLLRSAPILILAGGPEG